MELSRFKELDISRNDVIEYTVNYNIDEKTDKMTRLAYFLKLTEEELPEEYRDRHKKPPFIEVAHFKDKNGCTRDYKEIPLEEILYLTTIGKSNLRP